MILYVYTIEATMLLWHNSNLPTDSIIVPVVAVVECKADAAVEYVDLTLWLTLTFETKNDLPYDMNISIQITLETVYNIRQANLNWCRWW